MACLSPMVRTVEGDGSVHIRTAFGWKPEFENLRHRSWQYIPCGHCEGCLARRSKEWADRMMIESTFHENNWFVTLTFNDECLRQHGPSLNVRDVQLFMKLLRQETGQKLRFFAAGEYGDIRKTFRPHYHLIIFGLDLPDGDLLYLRSNKLGQAYWSSKTIEKCWTYGEKNNRKSCGFNVVGKVDYESCRYTARYVQKKLNGPDKIVYDQLGVVPPFCTMSRRPGLGADYMIKNPNWFKQTKIYISTPNGSLDCIAPKYFERQLEKSDPELHELRKYIRSDLAYYQDKAVLSQTDKDKWNYSKTLESNLKKSLEVLTSFETL